jgi:hypothetical protein
MWPILDCCHRPRSICLSSTKLSSTSVSGFPTRNRKSIPGVADDDRIFHTPFQTDAQLQEESLSRCCAKKRTAFCCKRSSTKSLPLEQASDRRSICFHYLATNVSPSSGGYVGDAPRADFKDSTHRTQSRSTTRTDAKSPTAQLRNTCCQRQGVTAPHGDAASPLTCQSGGLYVSKPHPIFIPEGLENSQTSLRQR